MSSNIFKQLFCPLLLALLVVLFTSSCSAKIFKGDMIAIQFTAYNGNSSYNETLEDTKEKMKLVSTQFNRVFSFGVMARHHYIDDTFDHMYDRSFPQVYSAEAAGLVQRETEAPLKIFVGIYPHLNFNRFRNELELAIGTALKSEQQKKDTVHGFVLDFLKEPLDFPRINSTAGEIFVGEHKSLENTSLGLRLSCDKVTPELLDELVETISKIRQLRLLICVEHPNVTGLTGKQAFESVATKFQQVQDSVNQKKLKLKVIGQTGVPARLNVKEEVKILHEFWKAADEWTTKYKFLVVMTEAFDNPWSNWNETTSHEGKYGLWDVATNGSKKFNVFKSKILENNSTSKGGAGSRSNETPLKYTIAIFGMILLRFVI